MTYKTNQLPKTNPDTSETNCCPRFKPEGWDKQTFVFEDKLFMKLVTRSFFYIPIGMGKTMGQAMKKIQDNKAMGDEYVMLSSDISPWRCEHFISVTKDVPDSEMTKISGTFLSRVFEGPYNNAGKWLKEIKEYAKEQGKTPKKVYFYYTTCPGCAKKLGQNYVVGFAQV